MILPDTQLYINGGLSPAAGDKTYDVIGPWTGDVVCRAADASAADVKAAIAAARSAFDETEWSTNHRMRYGLLCALRDLMKANRERMVAIARHEVGSTMMTVFGTQVDDALGGFDGLLSAFERIAWDEDRGRQISLYATSDRRVVREATGVVAAITPWNVPFFINTAKVVSALLAGCTVILKAAPNTPSPAALMGELAAKAGFPPGVFNVITSVDPAMAGELLVADPRVDVVSFTGSTAVGQRIMQSGAATVKRVFLELGGKSANIILDDVADFPAQAALGAIMCCYHAGQGCAVPTRLLVPKSRYAEAVAALENIYPILIANWGDFDAQSFMGPLISKRQLDRVMGYIESGSREGARLIAGGRTRTDKGGGFFVEPTCFVDVTNDMTIAREEIFGPVLSVISFEDDDDAVRIANDSDYGLSGYVFASNPERAMRVARRLRAGSVSVNGGLHATSDLPFGGYKRSGVGREWGLEGIYEYTETKAIAVGVNG